MFSDDQHEEHDMEMEDDWTDEILATGADGAERVYQSNETSTGVYKQSLKFIRESWIKYRDYIKKPVDPQDIFATTPNKANIHSFLLWLLQTRKGNLGKKLAVTTLVRYLFMFKTLFRDETGKKINSDDIVELRKALRNLFVNRGACLAARRRSLANRPVVLDLLNFLWAYDEHTFGHPRQRLQLSVQIMLLFYLGGRPGEIIESTCHRHTNEGLLYKDLRFIVVKRENRKRWLLLVKIRNQKFRRNVERAFIDLPLIQDCVNPELCPVTQLLALAIADGAFYGIHNAQDLDLKVDPPDNCHAIVRICDEVKSTPVLRSMESRSETSRTRIATGGTLQHHLADLGYRAGYEVKLVPYDLRRGHANVLNDHVSTAVRRQRMGHKSDDTFLHYISSVSSVDTQAMLHGREPENDLLDFVKSAALHKTMQQGSSNGEAGTPTSSQVDSVFPLRKQYFQASAAYERVADYYSSTEAERNFSRRFRAQIRHDQPRSKLIDCFYFREQQSTPSLTTVLDPLIAIARPEQIARHYPDVPALSRNGGCSICGHTPTKSSVASLTTFKTHLLTCAMITAQQNDVDCLRRLVQEQVPQCTWSKCQWSFEGQDCRRIAQHVARHTRTTSSATVCQYGDCKGRSFEHRSALKRHMLADHLVPHPDLLPARNYCFECRLYKQTDLDWREHCAAHLDMPVLSCAPVVQYNIVVMPGTCPFCLGDETRAAEKRYRQYRTTHELKVHLRGQHLADASWPQTCPHPLCDRSLTSLQSFWLHAEHVHDIKATLDDCRAGGASITTDDPAALKVASVTELALREKCHHLPPNPTHPYFDSEPMDPESNSTQRYRSSEARAVRNEYRSSTGATTHAEIRRASTDHQDVDRLSDTIVVANGHGHRQSPSETTSIKSTMNSPPVQPCVAGNAGDPDLQPPVTTTYGIDCHTQHAEQRKRPAAQQSLVPRKRECLTKTPIGANMQCSVDSTAVPPGFRPGEDASTSLVSRPQSPGSVVQDNPNTTYSAPCPPTVQVPKSHCESHVEAELAWCEPLVRAYSMDDKADDTVLHAKVIQRVTQLRKHWSVVSAESSTELEDMSWATILAAEDLIYHFYEGEDLGFESCETLEQGVASLLGYLQLQTFTAADIASLASARGLPVKSAFLTDPREIDRKRRREIEEAAERKQRAKVARKAALDRRLSNHVDCT